MSLNVIQMIFLYTCAYTCGLTVCVWILHWSANDRLRFWIEVKVLQPFRCVCFEQLGSKNHIFLYFASKLYDDNTPESVGSPHC